MNADGLVIIGPYGHGCWAEHRSGDSSDPWSEYCDTTPDNAKVYVYACSDIPTCTLRAVIPQPAADVDTQAVSWHLRRVTLQPSIT